MLKKWTYDAGQIHNNFRQEEKLWKKFQRLRLYLDQLEPKLFFTSS